MRAVMPALRHHFGLTESDVDSMSRGQRQPYLDALAHLPPIGAVYQAIPKGV